MQNGGVFDLDAVEKRGLFFGEFPARLSLSAIATGAAGSFQMTGVARKGLDGDFNPGFMLKHFGKDLAIGNETATAYGASLPILAMVLHEVRKLEQAGEGNLGTQALLKYYNVKE